VAYITDLHVFLTSVLALAVVVAITVSLIKPLIEVVMAPDTPLHNTIIRLVAILCGVLYYGAITLAVGGRFSATFVVFAVLNGAIVGLAAIGTFHLLTGTYYGGATSTSEPASTKAISVPSVWVGTHGTPSSHDTTASGAPPAPAPTPAPLSSALPTPAPANPEALQIVKPATGEILANVTASGITATGEATPVAVTTTVLPVPQAAVVAAMASGTQG